MKPLSDKCDHLSYWVLRGRWASRLTLLENGRGLRWLLKLAAAPVWSLRSRCHYRNSISKEVSSDTTGMKTHVPSTLSTDESLALCGHCRYMGSQTALPALFIWERKFHVVGTNLHLGVSQGSQKTDQDWEWVDDVWLDSWKYEQSRNELGATDDNSQKK